MVKPLTETEVQLNGILMEAEERGRRRRRSRRAFQTCRCLLDFHYRLPA